MLSKIGIFVNGGIQQMHSIFDFYIFASNVYSGNPNKQEDEKRNMGITFDKMQITKKLHVLRFKWIII